MSVPSVTNCPNCGAPIDGDKCPYCGTRLINIADLDAGEPIWLIFKDRLRGISRGIRVLVNSINVNEHIEPNGIFYADNVEICRVNHTHEISVEIDGVLTDNSKGFYGIAVDQKVAEDPEIRHYI